VSHYSDLHILVQAGSGFSKPTVGPCRTGTFHLLLYFFRKLSSSLHHHDINTVIKIDDGNKTLSSYSAVNIIISRHSCRDSFCKSLKDIHNNIISEGIATTMSAKANKEIILAGLDKACSNKLFLDSWWSDEALVKALLERFELDGLCVESNSKALSQFNNAISRSPKHTIIDSQYPVNSIS
jgi:hypothetical protein